MQRRQFIRASSALALTAGLMYPAGLYANNRASLEARAGILRIPDTLREEFRSFDSSADLEAYREQLFSACIRLDTDRVRTTAVPGQTTMCWQQKTNGYHAWALWLEGGDGVELLDYVDANFPLSKRDAFRHWLTGFSPANWDDVVLVSAIYPSAVLGVANDVSRHRPNPWLDKLLHSTRGILLYRYQSEALLRYACTVSGVDDLADRILGSDPESLDQLGGLLFEDGRPLEDVISEREYRIGSGLSAIVDFNYLNLHMANMLWEWRAS